MQDSFNVVLIEEGEVRVADIQADAGLTTKDFADPSWRQPYYFFYPFTIFYPSIIIIIIIICPALKWEICEK